MTRGGEAPTRPGTELGLEAACLIGSVSRETRAASV